jgi:hypothetical protein
LQPDGCFVAEVDGQGAGTAAAFVFGKIGWIAMVLVDTSYRRQGIGTALMQHALAFLESHHVATIRLDATAQGQPVYAKLGFVGEYELARYAGTLVGGQPESDISDARNIQTIIQLDERVTATPRAQLLEALAIESGGHAYNIGTSGYLMNRPGTRATQIGPAAALDDATGLALFRNASQRLAGQSVFIDIPLNNAPAIAWAAATGLTVQRTFLRMRRGPAIADHPQQIWASSGPEKG